MTFAYMIQSAIFELVGPNRAVQIFGIRLVGINAENGKKLLFSLVFILLGLCFSAGFKSLSSLLLRRLHERHRFWTAQAVQVFTALALVVGVVSIWFDDPARLATAFGLVTAGLAFALQRVVTAIAGYVVILRGNTFSVGDRIVMGGVRGDVIALTFTQTKIMEMGQPPSVQSDDPAMWVRARQYTGRVVTVTNAKIFDEAVYNYTQEFPFLWEELSVPISYKDDRSKAERILLEIAHGHTVPLAGISSEALKEMQRRYAMETPSVDPSVYWRITDNWVELTVRFLVRERGIREIKDKMSREILQRFDEAGIGIASTTYEIVGLPPVQISAGSEPALRER
jgi:small-conductance mechanosensitive channel